MNSVLTIASFGFVILFAIITITHIYQMKKPEKVLILTPSKFWIIFNTLFTIMSIIFISFLYSQTQLSKDATNTLYYYLTINSASDHYLGIVLMNFSHAGIIHFGLNMYMFYICSRVITQYYSIHTYKTILLTGALFTGIGSFVFYNYFSEMERFIVLGVSGVIYTFAPFFVKIMNRNGLIINGAILLASNIFIPNMAVASHILGFVAGYILMIYHERLRDKHLSGGAQELRIKYT